MWLLSSSLSKMELSGSEVPMFLKGIFFKLADCGREGPFFQSSRLGYGNRGGREKKGVMGGEGRKGSPEVGE